MGPKTKRFTFLLCFLSQASALVFIGCGGAQKPENSTGTAPSGITGSLLRNSELYGLRRNQSFNLFDPGGYHCNGDRPMR
jgi:hypothetical protein